MAENGNCSVEGGEGEESVEYTPQVFQCQGCREILADSLTLNDPLAGPRACWEMSCLSFTAVSESVTVGQDLTTTNNKADKDYGCFYLPLTCSRCELEVGKMYKATPPEFDALRNLFIISLEKVTNYDLGSGVSAPQCDLGAIVSAHAKLEMDMAKLKNVVLKLSETVSIFQQAMREEEEEPDTKENILSPDRKHLVKHKRSSGSKTPLVKHERSLGTKTPVVKHERSSGTPSSRGSTHKMSYDHHHQLSPNGYRSPSASRMHRRKKARIDTLTESESD